MGTRKLTFNATSLNIGRAKAAGLVEHEPLRIPNPWVRHILCPPALDAELQGKVPGGKLPAISIALIIFKFAAGHALVLSQKKRAKPSSRKRDAAIELERLDGFNEIWVLCHRKPGSGQRILGRFLEKDVLVLYRAHDKRDIGNDYSKAVQEVEADWKRDFGTQPPCQGDWVSAYLSGSHYDADEKKQI